MTLRTYKNESDRAAAIRLIEEHGSFDGARAAIMVRQRELSANGAANRRLRSIHLEINFEERREEARERKRAEKRIEAAIKVLTDNKAFLDRYDLDILDLLPCDSRQALFTGALQEVEEFRDDFAGRVRDMAFALAKADCPDEADFMWNLYYRIGKLEDHVRDSMDPNR